MKLIGKIFFILLFSLNLFSATASLSVNKIEQGDRVVLILSASGESVEFPDIKEIAGFEVLSTGLSQSIEYINGKLNKKLEKHYEFMPTKSVDIAPFKIKVDNKEVKTNPLHVEVIKADLKNRKFLLEMKISKNEVMQFEAIKLEFIFKRDITQDVVDLRFLPPKFDNFWVKEGKKQKPYQENNFIVHKMTYFIYPQKSGNFELNPARVDVGLASQQRDIFGLLRRQLNWKSVFSNPLEITVKPLVGAKLYGHFDIETKVDKKKIKANEAVNFEVKIKGNGNFDDIDEFDLKIDGANIYKDKPIVKTTPLEDKIKGEFSQKFSINSDKDFTIPPLKITYYDRDLKRVVTKKTKAVNIVVKGGSKEDIVQIAPVKKEIVKEVSVVDWRYVILAFIAGFLISSLIFYLYFKKRGITLPKFKNDKDFLKELLKYRGKNEDIDKQIKLLEENLYANKRHKIDRKVLKKVEKNYLKSY